MLHHVMVIPAISRLERDGRCLIYTQAHMHTYICIYTRIHAVYQTINLALDTIIAALVILFGAFIAYAHGFYLAFGHEIEEYRTLAS